MNESSNRLTAVSSKGFWLGLCLLGVGAVGSCWFSGCGSAVPSIEVPTAQGDDSVSPALVDRSPLQVAEGTAVLGYNLDYPGEWTGLPPFIDHMKNTRSFVGQCDDGCGSETERAAQLDLDPAGWPRSLRFREDPTRQFSRIAKPLVTTAYRDDVGARYVVTWEGKGRVRVTEAEVLDGSTSAGRFSFRLERGTHFVEIAETDSDGTGDYVRNIRVFRDEYESLLDAGEVFDPLMLDYLRPFRSLRFMDWMASNVGGLCSGGERHGEECYANLYDGCGAGRCVMPGVWQERPTEDRTTWLSSGQFLDPSRPQLGLKSGGYALEVMIALANRVGADPHFNIPVAYEDDYAVQFAQVVLEQLDPSLMVTVEYSNELWNWSFPQADYVHQMGQQLMSGVGSAYVQFAAGRTNELCGLWKDVFAGQQQRLRCVISPQTGYRDIAETALNCPDYVRATGQGDNCTTNVDSINVAGYFSGCLPDNTERLKQWLADNSLEEAKDIAFEQLLHSSVIADCEEDSLDYAVESYSFFGKLASARNLGLYVYEGGTHFEYAPQTREGVYDQQVADFLAAVARDERIYEAYLRNFQAFRDAGGEVFNTWGWVAQDLLWTNVNSVTDRNHPKYRAIVDYVQGASK